VGGILNKLLATLAILAISLTMPESSAQSTTVDHLTQSQLLEQAKQLEPKATGSGSASAKLSDYHNHYTMISLRTKNGGAEIHLQYADIFIVLRGKATLVTGGTVADPQTVSPGEIRGTAINGGARLTLAKGDFVHIPANVPHQLLLENNSEFVYFVIKVQEQ
jgi:mannose-6-phosphate isomerase-like protein (cupin superfamily)